MNRPTRAQGGLTVVEILTAVVALVVITAVAIPMWRTHQLRERRADAMDALEAVQKAQDQYFAEHSRYADSDAMQPPFPGGLGMPRVSRDGHYQIAVERSADGLGYVATARVVDQPDARPDARCQELRLDHHGRRTAVNDQGADTSADCWNRK
jgi:Tfp pilus assembly protein PilE